jgi:hypothetical protein
MFKNREMRVKWVKTNKKNDEEIVDEMEVPLTGDTEKIREISEIAKDFVKHTAIVVGTVFAASMVLNAACQIAVNSSKENDDE